MSQKDTRTLFTAVFEKYEQGSGALKKKISIKDIRTREGSFVKKHYVFSEKDSDKVQAHLSLGEYISFLADLEFSNVEFQYPYGGLK